jgi:hypothetical protein
VISDIENYRILSTKHANMVDVCLMAKNSFKKSMKLASQELHSERRCYEFHVINCYARKNSTLRGLPLKTFMGN